MRIIRHTNDELVLFSPATGSRFMSSLMIGLGGVFFLLAAADSTGEYRVVQRKMHEQNADSRY
jgi:hypothetical protein